MATCSFVEYFTYHYFITFGRGHELKHAIDNTMRDVLLKPMQMFKVLREYILNAISAKCLVAIIPMYKLNTEHDMLYVYNV